MESSNVSPEQLFELCLRLGDDRLILGQLLSEWCGHAPSLEEDIALSNIALDCIGQASLWLSFAGQLEGKGRSDDDLAFLRDVQDFRCSLLAQQPNGDFACTILRHYLYDSFALALLDALRSSPVEGLRNVAVSSFKEISYHLRHSSEWITRLGLGTEESNRRLQSAFLKLWPFFGELFERDDLVVLLEQAQILPAFETMRSAAYQQVRQHLNQANILVPENVALRSGGRRGVHSESLGKLISEMQSVPRAFPGATW